MTRQFILIAAVLGFTGVALGAFGAHGLQSTLEANDRVGTFETAARYHLFHALALLAVAWLTTHTSGDWPRRARLPLTAGTLVFSGSLYLLAIFDWGFMGAVAPVGGVLLLAGWACIGMAGWRIAAPAG